MSLDAFGGRIIEFHLRLGYPLKMYVPRPVCASILCELLWAIQLKVVSPFLILKTVKSKHDWKAINIDRDTCIFCMRWSYIRLDAHMNWRHMIGVLFFGILSLTRQKGE